MDCKRLEEIAENIRGCAKCPLGTGRLNAVPGEGGCASGLLFIGEAPGRVEDETGRPFVGRSGKLLDELMASVGLSRKDVFITSVLKCRPPSNRDPLPAEKNTCKAWMELQLSAIAPRIIAPLGRHGLSFLQDRYGAVFGSISKEHGQLHVFKERWGEVKVVPLYHPAALIYRRHLMPEALEDMKTVAGLLDTV